MRLPKLSARPISAVTYPCQRGGPDELPEQPGLPEGVSGRESVHSPHMEVYLRRHAELERRGTDPVRVARVIHRVIRSRSPGLRHPVGLDARMGMLAARLLPERVLHAAGGPGDHGVGPSQRRRGSRL